MSVGKAAKSAGHCGLAGVGIGLLWTLVVYLTERGLMSVPEPGELATWGRLGEDLLKCGKDCERRRPAGTGSCSRALTGPGKVPCEARLE